MIRSGLYSHSAGKVSVQSLVICFYRVVFVFQFPSVSARSVCDNSHTEV